MPRAPVITNQQILDAARELFLAQGIRVTTADVARRAGVAEGSLFKRFKTKEELFRAAMTPELSEPKWLDLLEARAGRGDLRDTLYDVGLEVIDFYRSLMPVMMMAWSNREACAAPRPAGRARAARDVDPPPVRGLRRLAAFFDGEMRAGRLRRHDPEILARGYAGALWNYVFFELVLRAHPREVLPASTFLRGFIQLLFDGIAPPARAVATRPRARRR